MKRPRIWELDLGSWEYLQIQRLHHTTETANW